MQDADAAGDDTDSAALAANSNDAQQQHGSSISSSSSTANQQQQPAVASLYSEDTEALSIDILLHHKPRYGFNNSFNGCFGGLREELIDMVQLPTPDTTPESKRRELRLEAEDTAFDGDRYLGDYVEAELFTDSAAIHDIITVYAAATATATATATIG
eukprot:14430-Heterococcus_DN1.PRE.1